MAIISGAYITYLGIACNLQEIVRQTANGSAKCKRPLAKRRNAPRNARDLPPNGETLREMQDAFHQTAKCSAKCKRPSTKWRNAPRNARDRPPNGETLREMQDAFHQTAKCSAKCKRPSTKWRNAPRNARDRPPNGETLREMQETFRQTAKRSAKCKRRGALSGRGADYFVPFIASSSSIKSDVLLKGGTLCWPPSLPWVRSQSKKRPGRAGMISGGWREISL